MMDLKLRKKALQQLANTAGDLAESAIKKEINKIAQLLMLETQYDVIMTQVELLDITAYRAHGTAVEVFVELLKRLKNIELTYEDISGYPSAKRSQYQNVNTLVIKILEALQRIRYHEPFRILDIYFKYSTDDNDSVKKQAISCIEIFSKYRFDVWEHCKWKPQEEILAKIKSFKIADRKKYLSSILTACSEILSSSVEDITSTYNKVMIKTAPLPVVDGITVLREQTLTLLKSIYSKVTSIDDKKHILDVMQVTTRFPRTGYGDDLKKLIINNIVVVLKFMKKIVVLDDLQIMQKIEHDAYRIFHHLGGLDKRIYEIGLEIEDLLKKHEEYRKFRVLIGFESIYHDWEQVETNSDFYKQAQFFRESELLKLVLEINENNYDEWRKRIENYASIKSNDMATFPYFVKFLDSVGEKSPTLALRLLSESGSQLKAFIVPILCGINRSELNTEINQLIQPWINEGKYLLWLARFYELAEILDLTALSKIFERAKTNRDVNTLSQIIATISAQFTVGREQLIIDFLTPSIRLLTEHKDSKWLFNFWYRKELSVVLHAMDKESYQAILDNFLWLNQVDYQAEEILSPIAEKSPELVLKFFCRRLSKDIAKDREEQFEAIPYQFSKLADSLSKIPDLAVDTVIKLREGDDGLFVYSSARLLKNIFPKFSVDFEKKLIQMVQTKQEDKISFVIAILRHYDAQPFIHQVCKEIIKVASANDAVINEVRAVLFNSGVVSDLVDAYQQKMKDMELWLKDDDSTIVDFAKSYISDLNNYIEAEKRRADEDIILRKHMHGSDE